MHSHIYAIAAGWTDIEYRSDLPMTNFLGLCPDCRWDKELAWQPRRAAPSTFA